MKSFTQLSFASSEMVNNTTDVKGGLGNKRSVVVVTFPAVAGSITKPVLGRKHH